MFKLSPLEQALLQNDELEELRKNPGAPLSNQLSSGYICEEIFNSAHSHPLLMKAAERYALDSQINNSNPPFARFNDVESSIDFRIPELEDAFDSARGLVLHHIEKFYDYVRQELLNYLNLNVEARSISYRGVPQGQIEVFESFISRALSSEAIVGELEDLGRSSKVKSAYLG